MVRYATHQLLSITVLALILIGRTQTVGAAPAPQAMADLSPNPVTDLNPSTPLTTPTVLVNEQYDVCMISESEREGGKSDHRK